MHEDSPANEMRRMSASGHGQELVLKIRLLLSLFLAAPLFVQAQTVSGTTVVLLFSGDKAILAADSRQNFGRGRFDDEGCKIIPIGESVVFAATGLVELNSSPLSLEYTYSALKEANDMAKDIPALNEIGQDHGLMMIAGKWGNMVARRFEAAPASLAKYLAGFKERAPIVEGIFVGIGGDGKVSYGVAHVIRLAPQPAKKGPSFGSYFTWLGPRPGFTIRSFGISDAVNEFSNLKSDRAVEEYKEWQKSKKEFFSPEYASRLIELTIAFSQHRTLVGGPIDVVEVTPKGVRWMQRKPECQAQAQTSRAK